MTPKKVTSQPRVLSKAVSDDLKRAEADNAYRAVKLKVSNLVKAVYRQGAKIGFMERQDTRRGITVFKDKTKKDNRVYQEAIPGEKRLLASLEVELEEAQADLASFTN